MLAASTYQTLTEVQHILQRPDMYVGSLIKTPRTSFCLSSQNGKLQAKTCTITHSEAQEQIFLEIVGNAADNVRRSRELGLDPQRIEITMTSNSVTIRNYGAVIPVTQDENGYWIPCKVFSHFRTGSNFNDQVERLYIGKNGYGAKLTNTYSSRFSILCADSQHGLIYSQTWLNNMSSSTVDIQPYQGVGFTEVSYTPDFYRFQATDFDAEAIQLYLARAAEVAYTCQIPVTFNDICLNFPTIIDYAGLFFQINRNNSVTHLDPNEGYEICLVDTPNAGICASFVNGMITRLGGVHVDEAFSVVVDKVIKSLGKHAEGITITKRDILPHLSLFLSCRLNQPQFKGQTKEYLTRPKPKIEIPDTIFKSFSKWKLMDQIYLKIEAKWMSKIKKTDGKKRNRVSSDRINDANLAGGPRAQDATAIMCEGDSAEAYSTTWISQVPNRQGRDYFGTLPLHGKLLNTLNADYAKIFKNVDIRNIKEMIGLEEELDYTKECNLKRLRYGNILIMTDPDSDGKHIAALILIYFLIRFPGIVLSGRVKFLRVPILRIKGKGVSLKFYTNVSYNQWRATVPNPDSYSTDYFKGLGTSEKSHVIEDFKTPMIVTFQMDDQAIEKAVSIFHKTRADERKVWLTNWFNRVTEVNLESFTELSVSNFFDYELIEYSMESVERNIPDGIDAFKESQRKVFFAALSRLTKSSKMKVAQIAQHASEVTNYKHGPQCLSDAIITMSHDFVGSNNMPYFVARGMMGTRVKGGKDAAADRYVGVSLPWWIKYIYRPEDEVLLERILDEGCHKEVNCYYPILPMHLINGANGVGTGWSTFIPNHHPVEIANWLTRRIQNEVNATCLDLPPVSPWYKGFQGKIQIKEGGFRSEGTFVKEGSKIRITELPIGVWTQDYAKLLRTQENDGIFDRYDDYSTDESPMFLITNYRDGEPSLEKLHLVKKHSYRNMTILFKYGDRYYPKTYNSVNDLLEDFFQIRLEIYRQRKSRQMEMIEKEIQTLTDRMKFIEAVNSERLIVHRRSKKEVLAEMAEMGFSAQLYTSVKTSDYSLESVQRLPIDIQEKQMALEELSQIHPGNIWLKEISQFIEQYTTREA